MGFHIVAPDSEATPGVVSIALPQHQSSAELGARLQRAGYLLSYNSDYLRQRNWIQICLMGEYSPEKLDTLLVWLGKHAAPSRNGAVASISGHPPSATSPPWILPKPATAWWTARSAPTR